MDKVLVDRELLAGLVSNDRETRLDAERRMYGVLANQPVEAEGVDRQRIIESMCLTWRHDFGLDAPAPGSLASGMTERGRQHLRGEMGKLFDLHFAPALAAVTAERDRLKARNEWLEQLAVEGAETEQFLRQKIAAMAAKPAECSHAACKSLGEPHPFCEFAKSATAAKEA